jgi:hypothetical protein
MKTATNRFFRLCVVLGVSAGLSPRLARADATLSIGNAPGYPGAVVAVPVALSRATNVVAAQFDVAFNPGKVASGAALPGPASGNPIVVSREISPGLRRVVVFSLNNTVITNRTLAQLTFTVPTQERIGSGPLTPANVIVARSNATALTPLALNSGTIFGRTVNLLPEGHAQFFLPSTPDQRYAIQGTTNLVDWFNLSTNVATGSFLDLVDVDAANSPYRFYRWQLLPP